MDVERTPSVADTGFVVALLNRRDAAHVAVAAVYEHQRGILLPQSVLPEVAYLTGRAGGIAVVIAFLRQLPASRFRVVALTAPDLARTAEILAQYADSRIDFVDATVMAVAERYGSQVILTLDRRDFQLFRPSHCPHFMLYP